LIVAALVEGGNGRRESAWRETNPETTPDRDLYTMGVSLREQQLLLRLRMLEAGEFRLVVVKDGRGMTGLREWDLSPTLP
jgi:hypothetical protein